MQGVFQDPFSSYNPIYRADRVFELVRGAYFPKISAGDWSAKIEAALDAVALNPGDVLGKYPHQLSGGQQQRLLIARALLLDVKVLIADEIISMLDASTRVDVLNLLVKLKRQGLAILFITHDLSLGNYVSDRTIILRHGAIVEMGATEKIFGNPQHDYTRMLLSAVPELHKKWQHSPLGAVPGNVAVNGATPPTAERRDAPAQTIEGWPNGPVATPLAQASLLDELTHAEQVVKRDLRAVFGGTRAVASGKSQVAVALEPPDVARVRTRPPGGGPRVSAQALAGAAIGVPVRSGVRDSIHYIGAVRKLPARVAIGVWGNWQPSRFWFC